MAQKQRKPKASAGIHGARKHPLSYGERILVGKGAYAALAPIPVEHPWTGVQSVTKPFDAEQAKANRTLYPHLFGG